MENRTGLVGDGETTHATGTAEREAAKAMVGRTITKTGAPLGEGAGPVHTFAAYNLTRMASIFGWRLSTAWGEVRLEFAEEGGKSRRHEGDFQHPANS